jgi:DNA processing protein
VLGCGLNVLFPPENGKLYSQILAKGGLVLSEYEPKEKPARWMFPQRNRIVAGLSQGILVVEAGEKSGSLITARIGFQQKKKVMAVPGPINSSLSVGTNWLIRNGAVAVTRVEEILEELPHFRKVGKGKTSKQRVLSDLAPKEKRIIKELEKEALEVDDLARKLRLNVVELGSLLSLMSLKGLVKERVGKYSLS